MRTILTLILAFPCIAAAQSPPEKIPVLLIDGQNNHDWPRASAYLKSILESSHLFTVTITTTPPKSAPPEAWNSWRPNFNDYAVVLSNFNGGHQPTATQWPPEVEQSFERYLAAGHGLVVYHAANNAFLNWPAWNQMIALGWRDPSFGPSLIIEDAEPRVTRKLGDDPPRFLHPYPDQPRLRFIPTGQGMKPGHGPEHDFLISTLDPDHPITRGMPPIWLHLHDQLTHGQHGPAQNIHILTYAWSKDSKQNEPMDWTTSYGKGRAYVTMLGHLWKDGPDTPLRSPAFQTLLIRGTQWAATNSVSYPLPPDFPTPTTCPLRPAPTTRPGSNQPPSPAAVRAQPSPQSSP